MQHSLAQLDEQAAGTPFVDQVTEDEVLAAMQRDKNMKAPSNDGIVILQLKRLSGNANRLLFAIFTRFIQLNYFLKAWREPN